MRQLKNAAATVLALLLVFLYRAAPAQDVPRITVPVSQVERSILPGSLSAKLRRATDEGPVQPGQVLGRMMLMLTPSAQQQTALEQLLVQQRDPASPDYRHWLTPEEYAARFGVGDADVQTLTSWLDQQGFTQIQVSHTRRFLSFSGTAGSAQTAFATQLHRVHLDGQSHIANTTAPSIPSAFAGIVTAIVGLDDFPATSFHKTAARSAKANTESLPSPIPFTPALFASEYDLGPLQAMGINGAGVKVVLVGQADPSISDLNLFQGIFGLQKTSPAVFQSNTFLAAGSNDPGASPGPTYASDAQEAALDLEWVAAVAPGATIVYDYATNAITQALVDAIDYNRGQIVSVSFGDCETSYAISDNGLNLPEAIDGFIQTANAMGMTIVAASGDAGAAACDVPSPISAAGNGLAVNFPASDPGVTAVGGTEFTAGFSNAPSSYVPETAWNDTTQLGYLAASGGGESVLSAYSYGFQQPSWQNVPGVPGYPTVPNSDFSLYGRFVPDVALNASITVEPYTVYSGGVAISLGGTSAAAPSYAGILALVQQYLTKTGIPPGLGLGNVNPMLYTLFQQVTDNQTGARSVFHDKTSGSNIVPCTQGSLNCPTTSCPTPSISVNCLGFSAVSGHNYDEVTGLGSVDAFQLATWWGYLEGTPALSATPSSATFASQIVDTSSDAITIALSNNGTGLLTLSSINLVGTIPTSGAPLALANFTENDTCGSPKQIVPGGTCNVSITFTPPAGGAQSALLVIASNAAGSPMSIPLTGTGIAPVQSGTFGSVPLSTVSNPFNASTGYGGGPLIQAPDGNYYGVNAYGGTSAAAGQCPKSTGVGCGTIFQVVAKTGAINVLYNFTGGTDGALPSSLLLGPDGNLYGTALQGGSAAQCTGCGTLFELPSTGTFPSFAAVASINLIYSFGQTTADGQNPSTLTLGADGNIYGTTLGGGTFVTGTATGAGTIFAFTPGATGARVVYSFAGGAAGSSPETLVQGSNGLFYGMTQETQAGDYGTVFQIGLQPTASSNFHNLYSFQSLTDGANVKQPSPGTAGVSHIVVTQPSHAQTGDVIYGLYATPKALVQYGGNFYGTTASPFTSTARTAFQITPAGILTTLYTFTGSTSNIGGSSSDDGGGSLYGLTLASDGNFYGVSGDVIFRMTSGGRLTSLYHFAPDNSGVDPLPGYLLNAADGSFVDATTGYLSACASSTSADCGFVFDYAPSPPLSAPIQVSLSSATVQIGASVTLTWQVPQAYSMTAQQCYAYLNGGSGGGTWSGKQTGTLTAGVYQGSTTLTPTAGGTYTYALTCAGTMSASATLTVSKLNPIFVLTSSNGKLTATASDPYGTALIPTGTVRFSNVYSDTGASTLVNGVATGSAQVPPPDYHTSFFTIYANYLGDSNFNAASASVVVPITSLTFYPPPSFPEGVVGYPYNAAVLGASGGTPFVSANGTPYYMYSLVSGSLASLGLSLSSTGVISGKPTKSGYADLVIKVTDSTGATVQNISDQNQIEIDVASYSPLALSTTALANGTIGSLYAGGPTATGGVPPYTYQVTSGSLPANFTLNSVTGTILGTPAITGASQFTIKVTDAETPAVTVSQSYTLYIAPAPLTVTTTSLSGGTVNTFYSATLTAAGGVTPYSWSIPPGSLPSGLTLSPTGILSGYPQVAGPSLALTFQVKDAEGTPLTASVTLSFTIFAGMTATTPTLPAGFVGSPYTAALSASGGVFPYTWRLASGTLPPGISLASSTGVLSGIPMQSGVFPVILEVSDAEASPALSTAALTLAVNPAVSALAISSPTLLPVATSSASYSVTLAVSGGVPGYRWTIDPSTLPKDLTLDPNTGVISGTPRVAGAYTFAAQVTDSEATPVSLSRVFCIGVGSPCPLRFVPITPCRVVDTRSPNGSFGSPSLQALASREFDVPLGSCNIPSSAAAYSINLTAVPPAGASLGYLVAYPSGLALPSTSTLNAADGRTKANAAIVPSGSNGGISLYATNQTDAIIDIEGYFIPGLNPAGLEFYPLPPCRVADTRFGVGTMAAPIPGNSARAFAVLSSSCNVPSTAQAYSLNVTAPTQSVLHYLTLWPTGQPQPLASTLNDMNGTTTANAAVVAAGAGGQVSVFVYDTSDVLLDINGYFAPPGAGGLSLYTAAPCRMENSTSSATPPFPGTVTVNGPGSVCALPTAASAYVLNATVVPSAPPFHYLTLYPSGEALPTVSTLNAEDGAVTSNLAIVPVNNGSFNAYAPSAGNLILDVSGYFAP